MVWQLHSSQLTCGSLHYLWQTTDSFYQLFCYFYVFFFFFLYLVATMLDRFCVGFHEADDLDWKWITKKFQLWGREWEPTRHNSRRLSMETTAFLSNNRLTAFSTFSQYTSSSWNGFIDGIKSLLILIADIPWGKKKVFFHLQCRRHWKEKKMLQFHKLLFYENKVIGRNVKF